MTCAALPGLADDDRVLLEALRRRGVSVEPVVWEDPFHDWTTTRLTVIRSAWDYAFRRDLFLEWARRVAASRPLWNPLPVVQWNTHKGYLVDLAARGVPVVPTVVLSAGSGVRLSDELGARGWKDAVLKAAVAQSGRYAMRVQAEQPEAGIALLARVLPSEDMLLQPFLPGVAARGEVSVTFVEGTVSHAVRKRAAAGDFRVHSDHGGTVERWDPTPKELAVAERAMAAVGRPLLYGRVDLVPGVGGDPVVMELEVVEPELFLRFAPEAAERLADATLARLDPGNDRIA